ncbi:UDP-N-acetylmuramoyl-tripeptide--D-alanyl-D-alanine ligase [Geothermobacter hydrogeniphilus]|uniref:UDP-N-acetylmuramoyl-tripeptide--D-alanyl-D-alanine ligase n=1 Tax=Geothermobacter hydrogeniphilus TaxID=1969733 RepID=A0A1X0YBJ4_9BACT|nr:UDP-N-acetylmuramoyl-tripeptide--D-alanyl-D-alanine ligase [Geothermobacter hydrogeniphilus]ORJ62463.1 UDP-N-acetylmuramoylalanyl-D-glutamyl-2, 6-diaminopimelate--D-alanyl-D-alanine ligase [Geothermobacter hydrogeniphilus]
MKLSLQQIADMTGGRLTPANARGEICGVSTDSRTIHPGELFIPLRGPNYDGHDFLVRALRNGAEACLSEEVIGGLKVPVIQVADTLRALGDLAAGVRRGYRGPLVAITGSTGKTTTKEMLAAILSRTAEGLKSAGNFNNLVGLPQTLLQLRPDHAWAVVEMGMSARGEIARLAEIAAPNIGLITNVGPAHLETLHGLDGVARAKGELFAALQAGTTAVINADDPHVAAIPVANGVRRLLFGLSGQAEVRAEEIVARGRQVRFNLHLRGEILPVVLPVAGSCNVLNALAAAATAVALDVPAAEIVAGLQSYRPLDGRMEAVTLDNGVVLLKDYYNANPLSMGAALEALDQLNGGGRRMAVLGDMLELGDESERLHQEVGAFAAKYCDLLLLLGDMAEAMARGARDAGLSARRVRIAASHEEAVSCLGRALRSGDRVLIKGSRGMRMERIAEGLSAAKPRSAGN